MKSKKNYTCFPPPFATILLCLAKIGKEKADYSFTNGGLWDKLLKNRGGYLVGLQNIAVDGFGGNVNLETPDTCPICKGAISPVVIKGITDYSIFRTTSNRFYVVFACPGCHEIFVAIYKHEKVAGVDKDTLMSVVPQRPEKSKFDDNLGIISPSFIDIYDQALAAETYELNQIAGMGYRKALEFLIKDYAIRLDPTKEDEIKESKLGKCIDKYIDHPKIKATAKASAWLGNDETHYVRKFDDKDITDLKRFIASCVYWILADYDAGQAGEFIGG